MPPSDSARGSSMGMLIVAWLIVGIPAAWGVSQTVIKSLDLFRAPASPASQPVTR